MKNAQGYQSLIPASLDYLFDNLAEKHIANCLARYVLFDEKPITTPALWQDVEIFIRYKKRDVWSLSNTQSENARRAIQTYIFKYIVNDLKKSDITKILNQFFSQPHGAHQSLTSLIERKIHAPLDSLILTQEKITVTKDMLDNLDSLFEYPCWIDFTDEANEAIFEKIQKGQLTEEQIDYFLGATDYIYHYDQWFKIAKHILMTTQNAHVFWTAGDVLSIIWKAVPSDKKSQKWFRDQIFEIFWPRVGNVWPIQNEDKIDFDYDESSKILRDAIGWLYSLEDLRERLPELGDSYEPHEQKPDEVQFAFYKGLLTGMIKTGSGSFDGLMKLFFSMTEYATNPETVDELEKIATNELIPLIKATQDDFESALFMIDRALKHAKSYLQQLATEGQNLTDNLINPSK